MSSPLIASAPCAMSASADVPLLTNGVPVKAISGETMPPVAAVPNTIDTATVVDAPPTSDATPMAEVVANSTSMDVGSADVPATSEAVTTTTETKEGDAVRYLTLDKIRCAQPKDKVNCI